MPRAIAFILMQALLFEPLAALPSLAAEKDTQQAVPVTPPDKQEIKTRGFHKSVPGTEVPAAPAAAPPPPSPRGDGGRPDDTIGGLPGHATGQPERQP